MGIFEDQTARPFPSPKGRGNGPTEGAPNSGEGASLGGLQFPTILTELFARDFVGRQFKKIRSLQAYATDLLQWVGYLTENQVRLGTPKRQLPSSANDDDLRLIGARASDVQGFMDELDSRGAGSSTLTRKASSLASFYKFLHMQGFIAQSPFVEFERPERDEALVFTVRSEDEIMRLLGSIDETFGGLRTRALMHLVFETCAKPSELVLIRGQDVHLTDNDLNRTSSIEVGEGNNRRKLYLGPEVITAVRDYALARHLRLARAGRNSNEELFFINKSYEGISERSCRRELHAFLEVAGMDHAISYNDIRMSGFAQIIKQKGWNRDLISNYCIPIPTCKKLLKELGIPF